MTPTPLNDNRIIIIGGGQAASEIAVTLRTRGYTGQVIILSDEGHLPYQRPPLSKAHLKGDFTHDRIMLRPAKFYDAQAIEVRLRQRVTRIDPERRCVFLQDGSSLVYDRLAIATGARVRRMTIPGADLGGVAYLRTTLDVEALRFAMTAARDVVIVGAGFIGLEVAAVAATLGKAVTVVETLPYVMPRLSSPLLSKFYLDYHQARGVKIHVSTQVQRLVGASGVVAGVDCLDGTHIPAQLVIVGIGVIPNDELAVAAGLSCDGGILVDDCARTADPFIVAAGDCTNHPNGLLNRRLRLESVHNAVEQARTAAASLCDIARPYSQIPWFWSDQYELKLQMAGISSGHDEAVVRGDPKCEAFSIFYFSSGKLLAVDSVNRPTEHMLARRFLTAGTAVLPAQAADVSFDLKTLT